MPCNKPYTTYRHAYIKSKNGNPKVVFNKKDTIPNSEQKVRCGQCFGCRLEHSRTWAVRNVHESQLWEHNLYITLTYEEMPRYGTINKIHLQKFWKRLRRRGYAIRYYACGEYGDQTQRPHYHAILYNIELSDIKYYKTTDQGHKLYKSKELDKIWGHGFVTIGAVTFESCAYVSRYIMKKRKGKPHDIKAYYNRVDESTGETWDLEPEFQTMSRRPGIGSGFADKYQNDMYQVGTDGLIIIRGGQTCKPPTYYDKKYETSSDKAAIHLERIKEKRRQTIEARADDNTPARLRTKENISRNRANKQLPRKII